MNRLASIFLNPRFVGFLLFALAVLIPGAFLFSPWNEFRFILIFLEVILLFNIMIVVHELGHFFAARGCGMVVEKFALWFGPALWSKKIDGVEYILGTIPAGGYVALPQMANPDGVEGKSDLTKQALPAASPLKKIIVAAAGPLFSFLLAFVFAVLVWIVGKPVGETEKTTTIGSVETGGPADQAGLKPGDKILSIDGHTVNRFSGLDGVVWMVLTSTAPTLDVKVDRLGQPLDLMVTPRDEDKDAAWYKRGSLRQIGVGPARSRTLIKDVLPNSPAALAGIQAKDQIVEVNGNTVNAPEFVIDVVKAHPHDPLQIKLLRDGQPLSFQLTPERPSEPRIISKDDPQTYIGVVWDLDSDVVLDHPLPWDQVWIGATMMGSNLKALMTPHSHINITQLSGPIGIMNLFTRVLLTDYGWQYALYLAVIINVNLAIMNLLPLPVLDGGHITLAILEIIRNRPLSIRVLEPIQNGFAILLLSFMAYITFYDLQDSAHIVGAMSNSGEIKFATPQH